MQYGLSFPNGGEHHDARAMGEWARLAEDSGWDGLFLEDYIVWQGQPDVPTFDPWVQLAAMALSTKRVRLGTMVTALTRRRPWKVARESATLDQLSDGRLILGVGLGDTAWDKYTFPAFAEVTDPKMRGQMLDEALEVLVGLWSGKPFRYEGKHYHVSDITFLPRPVQVPRIPIWIGGAYPNVGPLRRASRYEGACLYKRDNADMTPDDVGAIKKYVDTRREILGAFDIALGGRHRGEDWNAERAYIKSLADAGMTWWIEYLSPQIGRAEEMRAYIERGPLRVD